MTDDEHESKTVRELRARLYAATMLHKQQAVRLAQQELWRAGDQQAKSDEHGALQAKIQRQRAEINRLTEKNRELQAAITLLNPQEFQQ